MFVTYNDLRKFLRHYPLPKVELCLQGFGWGLYLHPQVASMDREEIPTEFAPLWKSVHVNELSKLRWRHSWSLKCCRHNSTPENAQETHTIFFKPQDTFFPYKMLYQIPLSLVAQRWVNIFSLNFLSKILVNLRSGVSYGPVNTIYTKIASYCPKLLQLLYNKFYKLLLCIPEL